MDDFGLQIEAEIPGLRRYALALVGDGPRADDLVQDCLERAWERKHLWKGEGSMRAWLFTILHNLHANAARKFNTGPRLVPLEKDGQAPSVRAAQPDALEVDEVMNAVARLPENQREVILLAGMERVRYEQIAEILGIPLGTVMSRLFRGREKLRQMLFPDSATALRSQS